MNIGYIGLGVMGGRMADRLMTKGHTVTGFNRTKAKAQWLIDRGMRWGATPRAVAEAADIIFVMVTDSPALEAVAHGETGFIAGLSPGKVVIDMSAEKENPSTWRIRARRTASVYRRALADRSSAS